MKDQEDFDPMDSEEELSTDYEGRCGNCHEYLGENEKYCKYCGTKRGEGEFKPYENIVYVVYGPPLNVKYKCKSCGHTWIVRTLGSDHSKYCPECGKSRIIEVESKDLTWEDLSDDTDEE